MIDRRILAAAGAAFMAIALLSMLDATAKAIGLVMPVAMVVFLRYASGATVAILIALPMRIGVPSRATLRRAFLRSLTMLVTAGLFFSSLQMLPLVEAVTLTFTSPFFMMILSRLMLGEAMTRRALFAAALGFSGVVIMLAERIEIGGNLLGYGAALTASVFYAMSMILTRRDTSYDTVPSMILVQNLLMTLMALPFALATFVSPPRTLWPLIAIAGILGTTGHLLLAWAYARAPATVLGPFEFTALIWAGLFGLLLFGESPSPSTLAGAAVIVGACLLAMRGHASGAKPPRTGAAPPKTDQSPNTN